LIGYLSGLRLIDLKILAMNPSTTPNLKIPPVTTPPLKIATNWGLFVMGDHHSIDSRKLELVKLSVKQLVL